ncbi:MAG: PTS sugar transporter subunit IIC [Lachnospiraceae bacterium]|nr:PTS sugar transporter subunit IIC [Lachnospiraceae bacterium]
MITVLGTAFKAFLDTFGATVLVPIIVFILALVIRVEAKKALRAAIYMAIGLTAFNLILGILWGELNTVMTLISQNTGKVFDVVDIGWPAGAAIVYNNALGMMYFIIGLVWNIILFSLKITDTFEPTDIWNYYYFVVFALFVQFTTGSFALGLISALVMNLFLLLLADILGPALQEYYGYDGLTCTCFCTINIAIGAAILRWIFIKLKVKTLKLNPENIQSKLGFFGESAMIGLIMGILLGIVAYINVLGSAQTWAGILTFALTLAAMLVIYPTVSGMFVKGLIPISQSMNARMRSGQIKRKYFLIGIDPAVYFGETATVTTGLLLIPILVLTAVLLPGNRTIPLADIPAMPFMAIGAIAVFQGDILSATITGTIWYSICHYLASDCAQLFTTAALNAGQSLADGATYVISWCISANPILWVIYKGFAADGVLKFVFIAVIVAVYVLILLHFKKHRKAWYMFFGASEEFVDNYMGQVVAE